MAYNLFISQKFIVFVLFLTRVSDPHWYNADLDTDPEFFLIADSGSGSRIRIPDPDPGFNDLKLKKKNNS